MRHNSNDADPNDEWQSAIAPNVARRVRPSRRLLLAAALVGGLIDGLLVWSSLSGPRTIASMVFMSAFLYAALDFVTKVRFRYRPETGDPGDDDPSQPPKPGGWANPTSGQKSSERLRRLWKPSRRR